MKKLLVLLTGLMAVLTVGCSSSTTPTTTTPTTPTVVVPTQGTTWTFKNTIRDSTGVVTFVDTSTRVVVTTNMTYGPYNDVAMLVESFPRRKTANADTSYLRYLSNGDIARANTTLVPGATYWVVAPYGTHVAGVFTKDTSFTGSRGAEVDSISIADTYTTTETDSVKGNGLSASVINIVTRNHIIYPGTDSTNIETQTNSLIAAKGIFGNHKATFHTINGKRIGLQESVLIDYNLK